MMAFAGPGLAGKGDISFRGSELSRKGATGYSPLGGVTTEAA